MTHPDERQIMRYIKKSASMPEVIEINRHMADCPECMNKIQSLNNARENFNEVMDSFSLDTFEALHMEQYLESALEEALEETEDESLKAKIKQWLATFGQQTGLVFQAFQDSVGTTIASLKAPLEYGFSIGQMPRLAVRTRGPAPKENEKINQIIAEAGEILKNGNVEGTRDLLKKTIELEPGACKNCRMSIVKDKNKIGFIDSDTFNKSIDLYISAEFRDLGLCLAALIPSAHDEKPMIKLLVLTRKDEKEYYRASFNSLPGKMYTLIINALK